MMVFGVRGSRFYGFLVFVLFAVFVGKSTASLGDHLPEFKECVKVLSPADTTTWPLLMSTRSVKLKTVKMAIR